MWIALITPLLVSLGALALVLAFMIVFAETGLLAGFFLPGDGLLFTMGVLTASGVVPVSIVYVLATLIAGAVAGDCLGYALGRRIGSCLFSRPESRFFKPSHLAKAQSFVDKHGHGAVVLARFVPWARTFVPVLAGATRMCPRAFLRLNVLGGCVWVTGITMSGFLLGQMPLVAAHVRLTNFLLGMATLLPVLAVKAVKRRRTRRAEAADLPVEAPAVVPALPLPAVLVAAASLVPGPAATW